MHYFGLRKHIYLPTDVSYPFAQITFFKVVYRRHTNFACEVVEHTLNGNTKFGGKATATVTRNGDLATRMYLKVVLEAITGLAGKLAYVHRVGHALLSEVELEIGGSKIDKQYGVWMDVWYELTRSVGQDAGYAKMVGDVAALTDLTTDNKAETTLYIPLQFWFCRNTGLALPLIALQYHEVRVHFTFAAASTLVCYENSADVSKVSMKDASLLVDYVYLDSEERRRFAQVGHEYLIEQLQFTGEESATNRTPKYNLGFNHPTKELVWAMRNGNFMGNVFLGYSGNGSHADEVAKALVKSKLEVVASASVEWAGQDVKLTVDTDEMTSGKELQYNASSDVLKSGVSLYGKITAATVLISGLTVNVTSVSHTLTAGDVSTQLANLTDSRAATYSGTGVTVNQFNNYGTYLDGTVNPVSEALIQLNGHDRFEKQSGDYFNYVQPHQHHSHTPAAGINVYSFALHPEQHQPSGTANLSRIDKTQLNLWFNADDDNVNLLNTDNKLYVFAFSYNVLRIMSGMGGLAYSN